MTQTQCWHVTVDAITNGPVYPTRNDAKFAAGVILQNAPVGTRVAVTRDYETGTCYDVCRTPERGVHIQVREIRGTVHVA